jgi:hypothetical protein
MAAKTDVIKPGQGPIDRAKERLITTGMAAQLRLRPQRAPAKNSGTRAIVDSCLIVAPKLI